MTDFSDDYFRSICNATHKSNTVFSNCRFIGEQVNFYNAKTSPNTTFIDSVFSKIEESVVAVIMTVPVLCVLSAIFMFLTSPIFKINYF